MLKSGLTIKFIEKGQALPDSFLCLNEEAVQAMAGLVDAQGRPYTPGSVSLDGTTDLLILLCGAEPAGVMSCEVKEDYKTIPLQMLSAGENFRIIPARSAAKSA
jgi:hypothetical protein